MESNTNAKNEEIEVLVKLCISKNKKAEKELSQRCLKFIKRILSLHDFNAIDQDSKEDLIQDVLIKVLTKIEFYEFDNSSFYNWLYILTQNTYLDIIRKKKRRYDTLSYNEFENIQIQCCNEDLSDFNVLKKEKYDRIRKALKFITEKERKIIILYYIRELKLTEIGALLRMPTSTVHKTKDKAIKRIKEILNIHD